MRKLFCLTFVTGFIVIGLLASAAAAAEWRVPEDFATIQAAIDSASVQPGDIIVVGSGRYAGAAVTKAIEIKGEDNATIVDGPKPWGTPTRTVGFYFPPGGAGSGATITNFHFEGVQFPVFSRGADDVTVTHNVMLCPVQGVTNWGGHPLSPGTAWGNGWTITHNEIIDLQSANGGGIGIFIGDMQGGGPRHRPVSDNLVAHNKITGRLHIGAGERGGYSGTGIVLYADFRYGYNGGEISYNRVNKNVVSLVSDDPDLVDVIAFEMTDTSDSPKKPALIHDNAVGFNDFRDSAWQIVLTPDWLGTWNSISRNLGENRGHGLHPKAFAGPEK